MTRKIKVDMDTLLEAFELYEDAIASYMLLKYSINLHCLIEDTPIYRTATPTTP